MLINIPDDELYDILSGLQYSHRRLKCTYCGDNMDGSPSECSLMQMIKLLERKYQQLLEAR